MVNIDKHFCCCISLSEGFHKILSVKVLYIHNKSAINTIVTFICDKSLILFVCKFLISNYYQIRT